MLKAVINISELIYYLILGVKIRQLKNKLFTDENSRILLIRISGCQLKILIFNQTCLQ